MMARPGVDDVRAAWGAAIASALRIADAELAVVPISAVVPRADAPTAFRIEDRAGHKLAVFLCSAHGHDDMIERAMQRAAQARQLLAAPEADAVLQPLLEGRWHGLSFALLPHCLPLARLRPVWWLQRAALRPRVFDWLHRLTTTTASEVPPHDLEARFAEPLRRLLAVPQLATQVRRDAVRAADRLRDSAWQPMHVLMHGDLWKGNVLLRRHPWGSIGMTIAPRFVVIDWPGSLQHGYAMFDLVRLALSLRLPARVLEREVRRHCAALGQQRGDAMGSLLAALGYIALHLEEFPLSQFISMAHACHAALAKSER